MPSSLEIHSRADGRAARESDDERFRVTEKYLHPMNRDSQPMDGAPHGSPSGGPVAADGGALSSCRFQAPRQLLQGLLKGVSAVAQGGGVCHRPWLKPTVGCRCLEACEASARD